MTYIKKNWIYIKSVFGRDIFSQFHKIGFILKMFI